MIPVQRRSRFDQQSTGWHVEGLVSASPRRHGDETVVSSRARQSRPWVDTPAHKQSTPRPRRLGNALSSHRTAVWMAGQRRIKRKRTIVFRSRQGGPLSLTSTTSWGFWRHDRDQWSVTPMTSHMTWLYLAKWRTSPVDSQDAGAEAIVQSAKHSTTASVAAAAAAAIAPVAPAAVLSYDSC